MPRDRAPTPQGGADYTALQRVYDDENASVADMLTALKYTETTDHDANVRGALSELIQIILNG